MSCERESSTGPMVLSENGLKFFVTNRSTRLDFPTPVSPSSTTFTSLALLAMALPPRSCARPAPLLRPIERAFDRPGCDLLNLYT